MAGKHGGLAALIKKDIPWLNVFGCICHSFALCAAAACDTLDEGIISFAHNVYNFLAFSSKRQNEFKECQDYVEAAKHSILYPSKTRWLVMEQVVKRLLEQWKALNVVTRRQTARSSVAADASLGLVSLGLALGRSTSVCRLILCMCSIQRFKRKWH